MRCIPALCFLVLIASCAPPFSEMQTARVLGKDSAELMLTSTVQDLTVNEETYMPEILQKHLGVQMGYGLGGQNELRLRYELIETNAAGNDLGHFVSVGNKIGFKPDVSALSIPVGVLFSNGDHSLVVQPSFLYTQYFMNSNWSWTLAPKALFVSSNLKTLEMYGALNSNIEYSFKRQPLQFRLESGFLSSVSRWRPILQISGGVVWQFQF